MTDKEFLLEHPCGLTICRKLRESDLMGLLGLRRDNMLTGHVWYELPRGEIGGRIIAIRICFHEGALSALSLAVVDADLHDSGWSDWSQEGEERLARETRNWFRELGFLVGEYSWGTVYAEYDPKGGSGGGGVGFSPSARR
jgi:hypothetical protein